MLSLGSNLSSGISTNKCLADINVYLLSATASTEPPGLGLGLKKP